MTHEHPYVVLLPHRSTNQTDQYLVVHLKEWVQVILDEKDNYTFCSHHDDYLTAADKRDELNHMPQASPIWSSQEPKKTGVTLTRTAPETEKAEA